MGDFFKFLVVIACIGGFWYYQNKGGGSDRQFESAAGRALEIFQGSKPVAGQPVLLNFWSANTPTSSNDISHVNALHSQFARQVQFIAVTQDGRQAIDSMMRHRPMPYSIASDPSGKFSKAWNVSTVPDTVVLNASHTEVWRGNPNQLTATQLAALLK